MILIDGNAIFHRAYHSLPPFKTTKGETTNAIFGFLRMLMDVYLKQQPEYLGIAWDRKAPTFRHTQYTEYKATRAAPPDDLYPQLPRLKEVLNAFQIPLLEKDGFEADDLLGTAALSAQQHENIEIIILTGDQDAFQLVNEKVRVMVPIKGVSEVAFYDATAVKAKFGVHPNQIIDYKALSGDSSDNIPGVPGIGPKGAIQLLEKYENLDNIYANLDEIATTLQTKLRNGKESSYMSRQLATIHTSAPLDFILDTYETHDINYPQVEKILAELEFKSLIKKLDDLRKVIRPASQSSLF